MTETSEYYVAVPEVNGKGTFFFTECGNCMYSVNDENAYQGRLCPKCFWKGKNRTLYMKEFLQDKSDLNRYPIVKGKTFKIKPPRDHMPKRSIDEKL